MRHKITRPAIIISALCAAAAVVLYCTEFEFNNPHDPTNHVTYYCPDACVAQTGASRPSHCFTTQPLCIASLPVEPPPCTAGQDCPDDVGSCTVGGTCTNNVQRSNCTGTFVFNNTCPITPPPPPPGESFTESVNGVSFNMIKVAGGTFMMGCTEGDTQCYDWELPNHQVTLTRDYFIGETEVTQGLWQAVMGTSMPTACGSYGVGDNHPVYCVSWNNIVNDFLPALNALTGRSYRLPTEAEWEFAARGGNHSQGYIYSGSNNIDDVAWYWDNWGQTNNSTNAVGLKQPNELGIYDMSGNVWEWVHDWYSSYTSTAKTDPTGPSTGSNRVTRGGSWNIGARGARVSYRDYDDPDFRNRNLGFRLAVSP